MKNDTDTHDMIFMRKALICAKKAYAVEEVPIGAVIVHDGRVIASGYNQKEKKNSAIRHAEMIAIERASKALNNWRLIDTTLYVNVEPCIMCVGAAIHARIKRVVYGCADSKFGACDSLYSIGSDLRLNHNFSVTRGVLEEESIELMQSFFKELRKR